MNAERWMIAEMPPHAAEIRRKALISSLYPLAEMNADDYCIAVIILKQDVTEPQSFRNP
jgi:hypothetical protein